MATPQTQTWDEPSIVQVVPMTPVLMLGAFLQTLRYCFADPKNIEADALKGFLWNADLKESKILIQDVREFKPENLEQRPAIFVSRESYSPRISMGQGMVHGNLDNTGNETHAHLVGGTMSIISISPDGIMEEQLAHEAAQYLMDFSPVIRNDFNLMRLSWTGTAQRTKIKECDEHMGVRSTFEYAYWRKWRLRSEAPFLKTIDIGTSTDEVG